MSCYLHILYSLDFHKVLSTFLLQDSARDITGGVVLALAVLMLVVNEVQKVYLLGLIRNPIYTHHKKIQKSYLLFFFSQFLQVGR